MLQDFLLLRYLEQRSFAEMFMSGYIRLNALSFFWGEHDEPTKTGQIDTMEGLVCPIDAQSVADCSRDDHYGCCNLLCCNRLRYVQDGDLVGWYSNGEMGQFGDYVVIIKDPDEFQRRLVAAASHQGYKLLCHEVDYSDRIDATRDVFDKAAEFAYQNEWRAALYRGVEECNPCVLFIGSIADIAEWCYTKELDNRLARVFHDHNYWHTHDAMLGNVTRTELAQLFAS